MNNYEIINPFSAQQIQELVMALVDRGGKSIATINRLFGTSVKCFDEVYDVAQKALTNTLGEIEYSGYFYSYGNDYPEHLTLITLTNGQKNKPVATIDVSIVTQGQLPVITITSFKEDSVSVAERVLAEA